MVTDTLAPTIVRAGIKENNISPEAHVTFDIRSLPRHQREDIDKMIEKAIGKDLWKEVEASGIKDQVATTSPVEDRFYPMIKATIGEIYPGANLIPLVSQGSTDSKFFRKKGITCYGFGPAVKDDDLTYQDLLGLAHNANERISVTNLMLAVDFNYRLMKKM